LGDCLREVYESDLGAPLPDHLANLVDRFTEAAREPAAQPETNPRDGTADVDSHLTAVRPF
jgi:hypothetical protein